MNVIEGKGHGTLGNDFAVRVLKRMDVTPEVGHRILDYSNTRNDTDDVKKALIDCTGRSNLLGFSIGDFHDQHSSAPLSDYALDNVNWDYDDLRTNIGNYKLWNDHYSRYARKAAMNECPSYLNKVEYVKLLQPGHLTDDDKKYFMDNVSENDVKTRSRFLDKLDYRHGRDDETVLQYSKKFGDSSRQEVFEDTVSRLQYGDNVSFAVIKEMSLDDEEMYDTYVGKPNMWS
jgi:hypothetical protein